MNYKKCDVCNRSFDILNFEKHTCVSNEDKIKIIEMYQNGKSIREIWHLGYPISIVRQITKPFVRSISESVKLVHKHKPESFKTSERTKEKIRRARLKYLKEHPEDTAWRTKKISYPERLFQNLIEQNDLASKYDIVREYSFFPYFIDFAFVNIKLAIEIDGSQHWLKDSKIKRDKEKEEALVAKGWKIYRIPEFKIKKDFLNIEKEFLEYLSTIESQPKIFTFENEIIEYEKIKQQNQLARQQKSKQYFDDLKNELEKRRKDFESIDKTWGWVNRLSDLWGISHTQVRRYINNNFTARSYSG